MKILWNLIYVFTIIGALAGLSYWFFPRNWLACSKRSTVLVPSGAPLPWRMLNTFGKLIFIVFVGSVLTILVLAIFGALFETN